MLKDKPCVKLCLIVALMPIIVFTSCNSYKNIAYFTDLPDTSTVTSVIEASYIQPTVQPDDLLSITIQTIDPQSAAIVNQSITVPMIGGSSSSPIGNQQISGFLVDKNGEVQLAMVGTVKLSGLTTDQARELIKAKASVFYKDPLVQVRFANFKVTLIGEVAKPATYTVPNEKVSILDVIGLAGDLTIYGKRENVLLVRENKGVKQFIRFNLNSSELFKSPYFYLKQNDLIYVEPNKGKAATTDGAKTRTFTIIASLVSLAIVAFSRL